MNKIIWKTIGELLAKSSSFELIGLPSQSVNAINYNSAKVKPGSCFVALKGEKFDGHNFIEDALWNGAKAVVCEKLPAREFISPDVAFIVTKNSRQTLAEISHAFFDYPADKMTMIGVTGTNGKTTCTFIIKSIIESANKLCGIIGTTGIYNGNEFLPATHTTPESADLAEILYKMYESGISYVAMEVSSHSLVQQRVACINFKAALFTNLTHEHLDYHKTFEEYAAAKKILFEGLHRNSFAVVNSDDPWADFMVDGIKCRNITKVGRNKSSDFRIMKEKSDLRGIQFLIYNNSQLIDVISSLTGNFNIDNAAMSAIACLVLGLPKQSIQHGLSVTKGAPGRMQRINLTNNAVALVDYAHTPDALEKAILSCRHSIFESDNKSGKIICVFGCGGDRDKSKRPEMGRISSELADISIITSDNPRTEDPLSIIEDIKIGISKNKDVIIEPERASAIRRAVELSNPGDLVLIAGKGHENYQIIGKEKFHFDDVEELKKISD